MGYQQWTTGQVLTSTSMNQVGDSTVNVFDDSSARSTAISSPTEGMVTYLKDTNKLEIYTGAAYVSMQEALSGLTTAAAFGADGSGVDVTFNSATAGDVMLWDASEEKLVITGTNGQNSLEVADGDVSITDALTVTGTTTTYLNVITDSGTTRTPGLTDASAYILCTHGSGMTVTLPQDSAVAFPVGTNIIFERNGAGTLTFAAGSGATVRSKGGTLTCADQYTTVAAVKQAANTWTIFGNIG
jgi:hypothetical protein|tara:strand:+ start:2783 stop:3511 length:729 start_codon:yes stop_codon:yes gene_type:complete